MAKKQLGILRALREQWDAKEWIDEMQTRQEHAELLDYDPTAEKWLRLNN